MQMKTSTVYSLGAPGSFDITDKDDPMYYVARLAHEQSQNLYNLYTEGFQFQQDELSDFTAVSSDWDTYHAALVTWLDDAVAAQEAGTGVPAIPTPPSLPANPIAGIIMQVLVRIVVNVFVAWLKKKFDSGTATGELVHLLKTALLDGDGGSLLYLLRNTPLEIILSSVGSYQDILYNDIPE
jgi:hypothetical protein